MLRIGGLHTETPPAPVLDRRNALVHVLGHLHRDALAEVVEELVQDPPTYEELRLLLDVTQQDKPDEQVLATLKETRLWQLLQKLARNDEKILLYLSVLLMIISLISDRNPPEEKPAPTPPAPQVTVVVPTDEIVDEIERRLRERQTAEREESAPTDSVTSPGQGKS